MLIRLFQQTTSCSVGPCLTRRFLSTGRSDPSRVSPNQVEFYLDEFVLRHNRRRKPIVAFQTLLGLGAGHKPTSSKRIQGAQDLRNPPSKG